MQHAMRLSRIEAAVRVRILFLQPGVITISNRLVTWTVFHSPLFRCPCACRSLPTTLPLSHKPSMLNDCGKPPGTLLLSIVVDKRSYGWSCRQVEWSYVYATESEFDSEPALYCRRGDRRCSWDFWPTGGGFLWPASKIHKRRGHSQ